MSFADAAERLIYRVAGLPVAVGALFDAPGMEPQDALRCAFVKCYWHPQGLGDWAELAGASILWPLGLLAACAWYTWRNGTVIQARCGKSIPAQIGEQLKLYFSDGVLAPWYYIFSLHDDGEARAHSFIQRFETKTCYFRMLKTRKGSPLNDKCRFAEYCAEHAIRTVPVLARLDGKAPTEQLPDEDLFVKWVTGRGGRGAQRWDRTAPSTFSSPSGAQLSGDQLLHRLVHESEHHPLLVQSRMRPHRDLLAITTGALPTVRVVTCLDEAGEPVVVAAVLRTSLGRNRTVDNLHAGGIGALVDIGSGTLGKASNLGSNARLGWLSAHPDTGAAIEGRVVPCWNEVKMQAIAAHRHFSDRVVVGWDIAILDDGPIFIEGNGNPDLDILQRFMRTGLREHRLASLLAYHLRERGLVAAG
jgi:hypothetical protein